MKKKWNVKQHSAFIMTNAVIAASLLLMAVGWLGMCEYHLKMQREKMSTTLRAARLAKEAVDQYTITGQRLLADRQLLAKVNRHRVAVFNGRQKIYEVWG